MTNPPFGGKKGQEVQTRFAFKTGATQVLFLQHVLDSLIPTGRCGIVLDEGVLKRKRTNRDERKCGWGGIRTPGGLSPTAVFKTAALDHSATHPTLFSSGNTRFSARKSRLIPTADTRLDACYLPKHQNDTRRSSQRVSATPPKLLPKK